MGQDFITTVNQNIQSVTPGYQLVRNVYPTQPKEYEKDFDLIPSERNFELTFAQRTMGAAQRTAEGGAIPLSTFYTYGQKLFQFAEYTLGINISRIFLQDNIYKETAPMLGMQFMQSFIESINLEVADFYANGWNTNGNARVGWDGRSIYGEHEVEGDIVSNTLPFYSVFNLDTFTQLMVKMWRFKASNGFLVGRTRAKVLTIPPELVPIAVIIMESHFTPGSASFGINPANEMRYVDCLHENPYIPKTMAAIRTTIPGMKMYLRSPFDISQMPNLSTYSLLVSAFMRFCIDFDDFRSSLAMRQTLSS